ncbi:AAA family ATPase [Burkholderia sp. SRS-W-2-2016]|uniref:AAA family ATPase n=1 Tax=Burkholderia sp. SRS-W-2-2016 TaxID=1926878 RepID=UPI00094B2B88|nr:AAA family ATPase [Burkholderia sp. SRS-W-2-2016]OLL31795.1 AAA family ATPase [Burkholderia sp. SRS-W-2-2016]
MIISSQFVSRIDLKPDANADPSQYPFSLPAIRSLETLTLHPKVTYFVGENGSGKSTLLEALAVSIGYNAEGGSRDLRFQTRNTHSDLHARLRVSKGFRRPRTGYFLRAESFYNVASSLDEIEEDPLTAGVLASYGGRSLHAQSHGESFLALVMNRFGPDGLYLLDEPEAALSPQRQLTLLARMHQLIEQNSQFVIATHSPILMAYPDATIYQFGADGIEPIAYEDTEHYRITRDFLANPERMLKVLLADSDDSDNGNHAD